MATKVKNVCMLSTHGYFDPIPELGKTDTGGQVLYLLLLARALAKHGVKTDIYTRWFDKSKKQIDPLPDCPMARVVRIPAGEWEFIPKEFIYDVLPELATNMIEFIKQNNLEYDMFHGHYVDAGLVTLDVAQALGKPAFFTSHSLGAWKRQRTGGDPVKMDKVFNFTHRVKEELRVFKSIKAQTVTSMEEIEKLKELYDFTPPEVKFTPPGVDVERFRALNDGEQEEKTPVDLPDDFVFVVSRISNVKGHDLLLPAFLKVLKEFPDMHLVIGGGAKKPDDEEIEVVAFMKKFIADNGIEKNVHLTGGLPNKSLPSFYRQAKVFILAAKYEPFGMTALEAMSCGAPVIVTKFSGIQENLVSGQDCLIVDVNNTEEYAEAICSLLRDPDLAKKLAAQGAEKVREEFSWEAIAGKFIEFYEEYV